MAACRERPASEGVLPFLEATQRTRREAERAVRKDRDLAEAYSVLAALLMLADEIVGTQREARRAIELSPILTDPY